MGCAVRCLHPHSHVCDGAEGRGQLLHAMAHQVSDLLHLGVAHGMGCTNPQHDCEVSCVHMVVAVLYGRHVLGTGFATLEPVMAVR